MKSARRVAIAIVAATFIAVLLAPYWTASALIVRAAGFGGWIGTAARWSARNVSESDEQIPVRDGRIRARIFRPAGDPERSAVLVSGVHRDGIDEPRLINLARELAGAGVIVVTPEIDDLINYRLTARVTDSIEDVGRWMVLQPDLFGARKIGLIGVSFSGGLSIIAAGRPSLRERIAYVVSFGGHGNLPRVLRYLCTGVGFSRPPHDYPLTMLLYQLASFVVPADQVTQLRRGVELFLEASTLHRTNAYEAKRRFEEARFIQHEVGEPSATLLKFVNDRDVAALGPRLLPYLDRIGQDPALSPDRSPAPSAPVYLLHGADDTVIPPTEAELLARYLQGKVKVRTLISRFLTHVDVADRPTARDTWSMIAFWKAVLSER
jgi:dienelactone hydrolase